MTRLNWTTGLYNKGAIMPKINEEERTQKWAIANKKFSLKTKDGIVYKPNGEPLEVPNGITRYLRDPDDERGGWDIYYFDLKGKYRHTRTKDKVYDGCEGSLAAAIELYKHRSLYPVLKGRTAHCRDEHKHKQNKLAIPGIRFGKAFISRRNHTVYFFAITVGKERQTVYVGMETTWEKNYESKFEQAKTIHKRMKSKHHRDRAFELST